MNLDQASAIVLVDFGDQDGLVAENQSVRRQPRAFGSGGNSKRTWANEPGDSKPLELSAISSTSRERDLASIECEVVAIAASNERPGYSGTMSLAFMPSVSAAA